MNRSLRIAQKYYTPSKSKTEITLDPKPESKDAADIPAVLDAVEIENEIGVVEADTDDDGGMVANAAVYTFPIVIEDDTPLNLIDFLATVPSTHIPVVLYFNCVGGDLTASMAVYHIISSLPNPTIAINLGKVYSGAVLAYMACDERVALPSGQWLIHKARSTSPEWQDHLEAMATAANYQATNQEYVDTLVNLFKDSSRVDKWLITESYIRSEEALRLGIANSISQDVL